MPDKSEQAAQQISIIVQSILCNLFPIIFANSSPSILLSLAFLILCDTK